MALGLLQGRRRFFLLKISTQRGWIAENEKEAS